MNALLATDARGEPLFHPIGEARAIAVERVTAESRPVQRAALVADLSRLLLQVGTVRVTEFEVTAIDGPDAAGLVQADVRFDLVGQRQSGERIQTNGVWRQRWRKDPAGWRIVEWKVDRHGDEPAPIGRSSARSPPPPSAAPRRSAGS